MIKNLAIIAGASFVLAAFCLGGAAALGGPHLFGDHPWGDRWRGHWGPWGPWDDGWNVRIRDGDGESSVYVNGVPATSDGATTSRDIAWDGADGLDIEIPANVQFTQSPGPAKLVVSGPKDLVDRVVLSGSRLAFNDDDSGDQRLSVSLSAPNVHRFSIDGDASLAIANYDQDELDVDVSGHGDVVAKGKARAARLDISGDGDVNLGGLPVDQADADISGSGRASVAAKSAADIRISGSGEVDLLTHPAKLTSDVSGSGRIVEGQAAAQPG
jgi:hypothetical protein